MIIEEIPNFVEVGGELFEAGEFYLLETKDSTIGDHLL